MITRWKISKADESKDIYQRLYRSMIEILLYVIASKIDIMHVVGVVARF